MNVSPILNSGISLLKLNRGAKVYNSYLIFKLIESCDEEEKYTSNLLLI